MMTGQEVLSVYEEMVELTGQMLAAANAGDWDQLVELEHHCHARVQLLKQAEPAEALNASGRQKKTAIIRKILEDDRKIRDLTTPWMAQLSALINNTGTQRRLAHAYRGA
jgi:flagellar protein FliT